MRSTVPSACQGINSRCRSQNGVVLVVVLWLLVLLGVLMASLASTARVESELVRNQVEGLRARSAAEAALYTAIDLLARERGEEQRELRTDGRDYRMDYTNISVVIKVLDEAGKVDINAVRPEMLRSLIISQVRDSQRGMQITDAILDWRDADSLKRDYGAEDDEYEELGWGYEAKDEYFDNMEELLLVLGMDEELYSRLMPLITIHTGDEGVNPAVAQERVLLAIPGAETRQVREFLQARDRYYEQLQPMPTFPVQNPNYINRNRDHLYSIHVQATTESGSTERIAALVRVTLQRAKEGGKPYEIVRWHANDLSELMQP